MVSNSVCMEEGPRGVLPGIEEPVARRADRRERRIKDLAKPLEDRPTLAGARCQIPYAIECLVFWGFGLEMHQAVRKTLYLGLFQKKFECSPRWCTPTGTIKKGCSPP